MDSSNGLLFSGNAMLSRFALRLRIFALYVSCMPKAGVKKATVKKSKTH
jgi:hypothetical protein